MKKIAVLLMIFVVFCSGCGCQLSEPYEHEIMGEWAIVALSVAEQYNYAHNLTLDEEANKISKAFPEKGAVVEFTDKKYGDGYRLISSSSMEEYEILNGIDAGQMRVANSVATYFINEDVLYIEIKDMVAMKLKKVE